MIHVTKRVALFLILVLSCLFLMNTASQFKKSANANGEKPFKQKWQRHQKKTGASEERTAFQTDIKKLSRNVANLKAQAQTGSSGRSLSPRDRAMQRLEQISRGSLSIHWDDVNSVPIFIRGDKLQETSSKKGSQLTLNSATEVAMSFLQENSALLQIFDPVTEFQLIDSEQDKYGLMHFRYQQMYQGLEVWARDVRVHVNKDGVVNAFNGRFLPTMKLRGIPQNGISQQSAMQLARQRLQRQFGEVKARKLIYIDDDETAHLTWLIQGSRGLAENWYTFVDAESGEILKQYNHIMAEGPVTGSGFDLSNQTRTLNVYQIGSDFLMLNASKPMFNAGASTIPQDGKGVIYTLDARNADSTLFFVTSNDVNSWNNKPAVSASANGALVYDFYKQVFNRNAIDGQGSTMNLVVNFKQNFNNAFWNGQLMVFGNGDGVMFSDLAESLDVTAHEMTHGVIERTANLVYENQAGALNESFADVFGVLFEFWVKGENSNWFLGEDVTTPNIPGDVLRNMEDPGAANVALNGQQPTRMSEFQNLPNTPQGDNGGVHINSGIPNRAFFLFATNPAVGRDQAGQVYYQALTKYITRNSQFIDCRLAVLKAIDDVFGAGTSGAGAAATAAAQAFDTVEIFDGGGTPPPADLPPVVGDEFVAFIDAGSGALVRYQPSTQGFVQISANSLFSRPSVTDDGDFIFYVDNTNNVHVMRSDGSNDQQLTTSGGFSNISISPNGQFLAATTTFSEPVMYVFDLNDASGASDKMIQLYTPTTAEGITTGNVLFPDRIDWASENDILMYDAFNIIVNATGDTTGYWDINLLRTSDGAIDRLFPPQPPGINIGNPVFSSNNDNIIALDFIDENGDVTVLGVNLNTGATGDITFNFTSPGSPSFSNDDSKIYYHFTDQTGSTIWVVDLQQDGITGTGNDQGLITGGVFPVAYTVGARPTSVEDRSTGVPTEFTLLQNYPNPFNPSTTIRYALPEDMQVELSVFNLLGQQVQTLVNGVRTAGEHVVKFDAAGLPSGMYFYRLKTSRGATIAQKMLLTK